MGMQAGRRITEALTHRAENSKSYSPGQWVYVWRRVKGKSKSHVFQRDRWVGPGAVVWHQGTTVRVAMRSRLWKCSSVQVRPATRAESLGAELLDDAHFRQLQDDLKHPGRRVGATDITTEGPPPNEAWDSIPRQEKSSGPEPRSMTRSVVPGAVPPETILDPSRENTDSISESSAMGPLSTRVGSAPLETIPQHT